MLGKESLTFIESLSVSGLGLAVVFTTLVALAVAIIIISKIIGAFVKEDKPAAAMQPSADNGEKDNETFAVLMAVISEDLNLPTDQFKIASIKEI